MQLTDDINAEKKTCEMYVIGPCCPTGGDFSAFHDVAQSAHAGAVTRSLPQSILLLWVCMCLLGSLCQH